MIRSFGISQNVLTLFTTAVLFTLFSFLLDGFMAYSNILDLVENVSVIGVLGLGMAFVVIGRGIDLSMVAAAVVPIGLVITLVDAGYHPAAALAIGLVPVIVLGLVNGWLVAYAEVPALFATLATGLFLAGLGQAAIFRLDNLAWNPALGGISWIGRGDVLGIPAAALIFLAIVGLGWLFLRTTQLGAFIYAIGDNGSAARTSGIPTRPTIVIQYVISALLAGVAGLILAAASSSVQMRLYSSTMIYDVILVLVLGGIGLAGGRGGAFSILVGTLLIGTLLNGMTIMDLSYSVQNLIKGVILLAAIILDTTLNPRNEQTAQQGDM